jgi:hypothetical protein
MLCALRAIKAGKPSMLNPLAQIVFHRRVVNERDLAGFIARQGRDDSDPVAGRCETSSAGQFSTVIQKYLSGGLSIY